MELELKNSSSMYMSMYMFLLQHQKCKQWKIVVYVKYLRILHFSEKTVTDTKKSQEYKIKDQAFFYPFHCFLFL